MTFAADRRRWGLFKASYGAIARWLAARLGVHLLLIHCRPLGNAPPAGPLPPGHEIRYLTADDLGQVAEDGNLNLPASFARAAFDRGDVCMGYFDCGRLVSYFWSGFEAVPMQAGLWVRVPAGHSYAYKALTLEAYRGRHLQRLTLEANDRELTRRGLTHNVEYVAPHNFAQRAASARYGNTVVGLAGFARWGSRVIPFHSRGVKALGFRLFLPEP